MSAPAPVREILRFGPFELDMKAAELRKQGVRLKLQGQPLQVLCLLLERPGEVVTREELRAKLWSADTFVDFDVGLNTAIKKVRDVLDDSAETPRFIETVPRRGYRFIYPVHGAPATPPLAEKRPRTHALVALAAVLLIFGAVLGIPAIRSRFLNRPIPGKTLRVAVLPLKNLSGDPEQEYFAAGMTEMLITELGRLSPLQVTSHQSVLGYAQSNKPVPQIARELGVDAVLEGTVQRAGNRIRVTVNIVQAQPENHLLARSFDRDARDIFAVQEDVARAIASAIRINMPERARPPSGAQPIAPEATESFLRGTYLLAKGTESDRDQARVAFQKAIEIDPGFARPYAYLAVMYAHGGAIRGGGGGEGRKLTRQWAEKALQLDDSLAEAHTALGWLSLSDWEFKNAEGEFKRAIELNPSYATARTWYAQFLGIMQRYPEAFVQGEIAMQLAPGDPVIVSHAVEPYLNGGRVDEAIAHWREVIEQSDYWGAHYFLAIAYVRNGMHRQALSEAEATIRLSEASPASLSLLAFAYAKAGEREKGVKVVHDLEVQLQGRPGRNGPLARAYAALGENEKALALLESAYKARWPGLPFVNGWPEFDSLRADPRYRDLLHRVGLAAEAPPTVTHASAGMAGPH